MFTLLVHQERLQIVRSDEVAQKRLGVIAECPPAVDKRWVIRSHNLVFVLVYYNRHTVSTPNTAGTQTNSAR